MSSDVSNTNTKLSSRKDWPEWYTQLAFHCMQARIWEYIDPNDDNAPPEPTRPAKLQTPEQLQEALDNNRLAKYAEDYKAWETASEGLSAEALTSHESSKPTKPSPATYKDVDGQYTMLAKQYTIDVADAKDFKARMQPITSWVQDTVDSSILSVVQSELIQRNTTTLKDLVKALKDLLAPSHTSVQNQVLDEYRSVIKQAHSGSVNPVKWHQDWFKAYNRALSMDIPEVKGPLASREFLNAIGIKMSPEWARKHYINLLKNDELGLPNSDLKTLGRWFSAIATSSSTKKHGVFATLGSRSDSNTSSENKGYECPCLTEPTNRHRWQPRECYYLKLTIIGKTNHR
jgi:hypothetical protein